MQHFVEIGKRIVGCGRRAAVDNLPGRHDRLGECHHPGVEFVGAEADLLLDGFLGLQQEAVALEAVGGLSQGRR